MRVPPGSDLAAAIGTRLAQSAPSLLSGVMLLVCAWVLCLVELARARCWLAMGALILALPIGLALSLGIVLRAAGNEPLPTTWSAHGRWGAALPGAALLLFIWPLAIFLASYAAPTTRDVPRE